MNLPKKVKLVEVSPRDGLQNEAQTVPTHIKIDFINRLNETGLKTIETTSFVSPKKIPQLADNKLVYAGIQKKIEVSYPVLIPNLKGLNDALSVDVKEIAVFTAVSETFTQKNINCSIDESLNRIAEVITAAQKHKMKIRGYLSCALGCPYEGEISVTKTAGLAKKLFEMGCYEISFGDTIGVATPGKTLKLLQAILKTNLTIDAIAVHFHDTYGQAIANIYAALELGIHTVDSSVAGLGGCPYAKGATGNVASEDVLYLLNGLNIETGVDLEKLIAAGNFISQYLGRASHSKTALALKAKE